MSQIDADERSSLAGCRIWLSAAVPDGIDSAAAERIDEFVRLFARQVFERHGTIVHGSHPTITPILLSEAESYQKRQQRKAPLRLVVSRYFSEFPDRFGVHIEAWDKVCAEATITTPAIPKDVSGEARARSRSLTLMRRELANQSHFIVAVGGKWWMDDSGSAGIPEEIDFARDFMLPLFLLGGLGGATAEYLEKHPEYLAVCRNGLSDDTNIQLASTTDVDWIVTTVLETVAKRAGTNAPETRMEASVVDEEGDSTASRSDDAQACSQAFAGSAPDQVHPPFFRILCLDGGGIRGAFSAQALATWETLSGERIQDHFDLIVGTSTGGILALGLGMGLRPADMVRFYREEGPRIFPGGGIGGKLLELKQWLATKFDRDVLRSSLATAFESAPVKPIDLSRSLVRLAITAYNAETDTPTVYRTPHNDFGRLDAHRSCLDIALATSAAPTYFDPTRMDHGDVVDGGLWANSPTTVALAEAALLKWDLDQVRILSVGTLFTPNVLAQPKKVGSSFLKACLQPFLGRIPAAIIAPLLWKPLTVTGTLGWLPSIASLLMKTQAQTAEHVCRSLLGHHRYLRVDMATPEIAMDDATALGALVGYGDRAAQEAYPRVKAEFLMHDHRLLPWQGHPADGP
jgi:predicted acylesterase/phospholipase RssA